MYLCKLKKDIHLWLLFELCKIQLNLNLLIDFSLNRSHVILLVNLLKCSKFQSKPADMRRPHRTSKLVRMHLSPNLTILPPVKQLPEHSRPLTIFFLALFFFLYLIFVVVYFRIIILAFQPVLT